MRTVIYVNCTDQKLSYKRPPFITSGDVNEDLVSFEFDTSWDGYVKTAVFYRKPDEVYHVLLNDDGTGIIPHEVLKTPGAMYFGVFGVKGDRTRTSSVACYMLRQGAITEATNKTDPTPDIYAQMLAQAGEAKEAAQAARAAAAETAQQVADANQYAEAAEHAARHAGEANTEAWTAASKAQEYKNAAAESANAGAQHAVQAGFSAEAAAVSASSAKNSNENAEFWSREAAQAKSVSIGYASAAAVSATDAKTAETNAASHKAAAELAAQNADGSYQVAKACVGNTIAARDEAFAARDAAQAATDRAEAARDAAQAAAERAEAAGSGSGSGGGVTSWNDLKDKPFGEERAEQVILSGELKPDTHPEYDFSCYSKVGVEGYRGMELALTINGTKYDAILDDEYEPDHYRHRISGVATVNVYYAEGNWYCLINTVEPGYVSVAVVSRTVKTLDPMYLPPDIGEGADIDVVATPGQMIVVKSVDENGKPTEWEAIDIPEGGAQADAVQADMAQSDSSKPDYIKNRTHWKETKLTNATEIIAETTITGARKNFTGVTLEAGKTYAVVYNGETYVRKAAAYATATYIGDFSMVYGGTPTGEPFCLWYVGEYVTLDKKNSDAATISVMEATAEEVYHQLDRRYIKDMYGDDFVEILPECQLTPMGDDGGGFAVFDPLPANLQPGETYTINWNGAAYECVALPYEEEGVQMGVMLGNAGALTGEGDSGEPFFMAVLSSEYAAAMGIGLIAYALDGSPAPTLSIMGAGGVVKIPEKYLPDCVVKTVNGISPDENGNVEVAGGGSGGGVFELLVDVTVEEEVQYIFQEFEATEVSEFIIHFDCVAPATINSSLRGVSCYLNVTNPSSQWSPGGFDLGTISAAIANASGHTRWSCWHIRKAENGRGILWSAAQDVAQGCVKYLGDYRFDSTIFSVRVQGQNWVNAVGAGSRLRVYGVRA